MVNCYYNLNTFIPDGSYSFNATIVASPSYPSGVTYSGTSTVSSVPNYCKPYKTAQKNIANTGDISGTIVTSTQTFTSKCDKYSTIGPGQYYFNGDYKICKKWSGNVVAKYKGFSQNYSRNLKGKSVYTLSTNGFTETIYYKINCGYTLYQTIVYTLVT